MYKIQIVEQIVLGAFLPRQLGGVVFHCHEQISQAAVGDVVRVVLRGDVGLLEQDADARRGGRVDADAWGVLVEEPVAVLGGGPEKYGERVSVNALNRAQERLK